MARHSWKEFLKQQEAEKERKQMLKHVSEWYNLRPVLGCAN